MKIKYTQYSTSKVETELTDYVDEGITDSEGDYCVFGMAGVLARLIDTLAEEGHLDSADVMKIVEGPGRDATLLKGDSE